MNRDQVLLSLYREVSALATPIVLGTEVTEILARCRCAPAVLAHPYPLSTASCSLLCREIDLFGAVRTTLSDSPPGDPPPRDSRHSASSRLTADSPRW